MALDSAEATQALQRAREHLRLRDLHRRRRADALVAEGDPPRRPGAGRRHARRQSDAQPPGAARRRVRRTPRRAAWCCCIRTRADYGHRALAALALRRHAPPRRARYGARDIERLFRFINGTALGLVACGGGALCAAHVGLYKALIECGLEFDIMGGTSAGAAMVGAFAMGKHPDDIDRGTHDIFVTNRAMQRYTWPRYSLLDHSHYDTQLSPLFRRHQHRGPVDPLFRRLDQPVELRAAPPRPRRPVRRDPRLGLDPGAAAAGLYARRARCWSTAACSTTCRCAPCTS